MTQKEQYQENRTRLIDMSQTARKLVETGLFDKVNEAIIEAIYKANNDEITEFKTFGQWKHEGKTIIKGSKAYVVWGQPRKTPQTEAGSEEPKEYKYWPLCYLFSNLQVTG